jgi:hypothetical protein
MSGLKINFNKNEVILINGDENKCIQMADLFNCQIGFFPIKYLGVPVSPSKLHVKDLAPIVEKMRKNLLFGKVVPCPLLPVLYQLSMYLIPKIVTDKLDKQRRTFFWQGEA